MVSNRWVRSRGLTYRPTACRGALGVRPFGVRIPVDGVWSSKNVPDRKSAKGGAAWLMTLREASWAVVDRSTMFDLRISLRRPQTPG